MRSDMVSGGIFPDYELPDHTGTLRKLSEIQGDDPLILTLARGRKRWQQKHAAGWRVIDAVDHEATRLSEAFGRSSVQVPQQTGVRDIAVAASLAMGIRALLLPLR